MDKCFKLLNSQSEYITFTREKPKATYDFGSFGLGIANFWYFVIQIAIFFVGMVLGAISWLRFDQVVNFIHKFLRDL
ncbi:hypothetical protein KIN20_012524 [Parelaphostrongylus tenuis]|uniref:Uncharacterized protein n=1 Tax=Parelaphostrongylus tenuis TaxID=148309 RepID=A0AAD5MC97_PARTN|nr:hypothetical protein KIN20_012524 [Parelaphostrongylus tenuis]